MGTVLITRAIIVNENRQIRGSVLVRDNLIDSVIPDGDALPAGSHKIIDAKGNYLIPGVIDDHVHFREPGLTHKADIASESKAAVAGGVTSFMEMPNTNPQTITVHLLEEKFHRASETSLANYSFYLGATNDNVQEITRIDPSKVCGIKVFMGSSTGNMLVDFSESLKTIFSVSPVPVAVHSEDESIIRNNTTWAQNRFGEDVPVYLHPRIRNAEACYRSTHKAIDLAVKAGTRLHILHLSTARELALLSSSVSITEKKITAEVCVHHLLFDERDYYTLGNLIKINPSVKAVTDKEALLKALIDNKIDVVATDHAPHTLEEKQQPYFKAPSGSPMVQHSLVAMMELCHNGMLTPEQVVNKMCHAPATIFNIERRGYIRKGYYADLVIVDPNQRWTVSPDNLLYKCRWSPVTGRTFSSRVTHTFVNGTLVYEEGQLSEQQKGMPLSFLR